MFEQLMNQYWGPFSALILFNFLIVTTIGVIIATARMCERPGYMWKSAALAVLLAYSDAVIILIGSISDYNAMH